MITDYTYVHVYIMFVERIFQFKIFRREYKIRKQVEWIEGRVRWGCGRGSIFYV